MTTLPEKKLNINHRPSPNSGESTMLDWLSDLFETFEEALITALPTETLVSTSDEELKNLFDKFMGKPVDQLGELVKTVFHVRVGIIKDNARFRLSDNSNKQLICQTSDEHIAATYERKR